MHPGGVREAWIARSSPGTPLSAKLYFAWWARRGPWRPKVQPNPRRRPTPNHPATVLVLPLVNPRPPLYIARMVLQQPVAYDSKVEGNVIFTTMDAAMNWMRKNSLWPMPMGLACCAIELMATASSRFDISRFGAEVMRFSPRQSDVMIVAGTVTYKMALAVKRIYEQMPEPKWVIAMGACASSGGMYRSYAVLQGVDRIIPVDVYISGCPPRPEALLEGLMRLQRKIQGEHSFVEQKRELARIPALTCLLRLIRRSRHDPDRRRLATRSQIRLGNLKKTEFRGELTYTLPVAQLKEVAAFCKDTLGFDFLLDISSVDNFGDEPRFELVYELYSMTHGLHLRLKTSVSEDDLEAAPTVSDLWPTADWHEREIYDMMGIRFAGHPDLRRILMWDGYPFFPLAQGFPAGRQAQRHARRGVFEHRAAGRRAVRHLAVQRHGQGPRAPRAPSRHPRPAARGGYEVDSEPA